MGTDVFLLTKPAGSNSIQRACTQARMSGDNNFLQAVHFCFISIFEGGLFCFVLNVQRKMGRKLN